MNIGVKHLSDGDILVLSDGDLIFGTQAVEAWQDAEVPLVGWNRLHRLDRIATKSLLETGTLTGPPSAYTGAASVFYPPSIDSACGGVNVIPRQIYFKTGGMVEVFEGWGGEDNATWARLVAFGYDFKSLDSDVWHLWHPSSAQYGQERAYVFWMKTWTKDHWLSNMDENWGDPNGAASLAYLDSVSVTSPNGANMTGKEILADISNDLGLAYLERAMFDEAIRELRQAVSMNPNLASAHMNLAMAYAKVGNLKNALSECEHALAIDGQYGKAHYNLAILYHQTGAHKKALEHCNKAMELGADVHPRLLNLLQQKQDLPSV